MVQTPDLGDDPFINFLLEMFIFLHHHLLPNFWTSPFVFHLPDGQSINMMQYSPKMLKKLMVDAYHDNILEKYAANKAWAGISLDCFCCTAARQKNVPYICPACLAKWATTISTIHAYQQSSVWGPPRPHKPNQKAGPTQCGVGQLRLV